LGKCHKNLNTKPQLKKKEKEINSKLKDRNYLVGGYMLHLYLLLAK
jgi:hypothetical protein